MLLYGASAFFYYDYYDYYDYYYCYYYYYYYNYYCFYHYYFITAIIIITINNFRCNRPNLRQFVDTLKTDHFLLPFGTLTWHAVLSDIESYKNENYVDIKALHCIFCFHLT